MLEKKIRNVEHVKKKIKDLVLMACFGNYVVKSLVNKNRF